MLENLLNTVLFIANTVLIGWLHEPAALAAIGIGNTFQLIAQNLFMALGVAALALVARAWGAGDRDEARRISAHAIVMTAALSVALMIPMLALAESFMRLLVKDKDPAQLALPNMAESAVQRVGFITYMSIVGGAGHGCDGGAPDRQLDRVGVVYACARVGHRHRRAGSACRYNSGRGNPRTTAQRARRAPWRRSPARRPPARCS